MPEILYWSGSIGLGHVTRDLAIARKVREKNPNASIEWLAGEPARTFLREAGERVLDESDRIENGTALAGELSTGFNLDFSGFALKIQDAWKKNVEVFMEAFSQKKYDLVITDESFELWVALNKNRELVKVPVLEIGDYIGIEPTSWSPKERIVSYINNRIWSKCSREAAANEIGIFIGETDDIPDERMGFLLPNKRELAKRNHMAGYVLDFDPEELSDSEEMKKRLGYRASSLIVCSIGGSSVGKELLNLCNQAFPIIKKSRPDAKMILVAGPMLDPKTLDAQEGVEVKGFVPKLYEYYAASDLSIIIGGGTSTVELTALRRPFIFFPLEGHHEQQHTVASRCARNRAGVRMDFSATTPESLAAAALTTMEKPVDYESIPVDGADKIAAIVGEYLPRNG